VTTACEAAATVEARPERARTESWPVISYLTRRLVPRRSAGKESSVDLLWIIVIVIIVLAVLGYLGRGRFMR
jgi:hypothetical protein